LREGMIKKLGRRVCSIG